MKKFVNLRSLFFAFALSFACVFFASKLFVSPFYAFLFVFPLAYIVFLIVKKRFITSIFTLLLFLFVSIYPCVFVSTYNDTSLNNQKFIISGKIEKTMDADTCQIIILQNVTLTSDSGEVKSINGNVISYIYGIDYETSSLIALRSRVVFSSYINGLEIFEDGKINTFYLTNKIKYATKGVSSTRLVNIGDDSTELEKFREYNKSLLISAFGEYEGEIAYSTLYGDRTGLDEDFYNDTILTGVAHIFAVSGLHVGLIVMLLGFLLSKTRLKEWLKLVIMILCLFAFCLVTSFSLPTLRASFMTLVLLLSKVCFKRYDGINSLSFAGIILLLLNPMSVFNIGFCMSFASVFAIIIFARLFSKVPIKSPFARSVFMAFALSLSADIGLLPIYASFGYFPTWTIIINVLIIPFFSIFYVLLFSLNFFVVIIPSLKFAYILPKALLAVLIYVNHLFSLLPNGIICLASFSILSVFLYYITIYILSGMVNIRRITKVVFCLSSVLVIALLTIIGNLPYITHKNQIKFFPSYSGINVMLELDSGERYVFAPNLTALSTSLARERITYISGVFLLEGLVEEDININFEPLKKFTNNIYAPHNFDYKTKLESLGFVVHILNSGTNVFSSSFAIKYYLSSATPSTPIAMTIKRYDKTYAIFQGKTIIEQNQTNNIKNDFNYFLDCAKIIGVEENSALKSAILSNNYLFDTSHLFAFSI